MTVPTRGSARLPTLEHAAVGDVMHPGIVSCAPHTDLIAAARTMAAHHIHALVVGGIEPTPTGDRLSWGLLSDLDLVAARGRAPYATAGEVAVTDIVTVAADEPLETAAALMVEHGLTHLLVLDTPDGVPCGVVSTLDIAGALGWGEA